MWVGGQGCGYPDKLCPPVWRGCYCSFFSAPRNMVTRDCFPEGASATKNGVHSAGGLLIEKPQMSDRTLGLIRPSFNQKTFEGIYCDFSDRQSENFWLGSVIFDQGVQSSNRISTSVPSELAELLVFTSALATVICRTPTFACTTIEILDASLRALVWPHSLWEPLSLYKLCQEGFVLSFFNIGGPAGGYSKS